MVLPKANQLAMRADLRAVYSVPAGNGGRWSVRRARSLTAASNSAVLRVTEVV